MDLLYIYMQEVLQVGIKRMMPERLSGYAVKGMLPKGRLGRSLMDNLFIYDGTEHKHEAQKPKAIDINQYK